MGLFVYQGQVAVEGGVVEVPEEDVDWGLVFRAATLLVILTILVGKPFEASRALKIEPTYRFVVSTSGPLPEVARLNVGAFF